MWVFRVAALLSLCFVPALWAQGQYATVSGIVSDSTGAVVPGVRVQAINVATGETQSVSSSETGNYTLPLLKPGEYRLEAEKTGFKKQLQTGIQLETGTPARIDIALEVGAVSESVSVEATAPLLQSETSAVGAVIQNQTIVNMPLIDRRAAQLARLSGFVVQNGTGSQFSIAGGRGNNAMWMIDGGNAQNISLGTPTLNFDPPVEALQEFNVAVSNYAAELGRTGGGVIQMTTKSGTNEFHGSAYEYVRNDAFDARNFFAQENPVLRYNLFGASLGGPIRKNRTHFFYSYEGRRSKDANPVFQNLPTAAEVRGDFSQNSTVIRDPAAAGRTPFPGNLIPPSRFDPAGAALAAFYPAPNVPGRGSGNANFLANRVTTNPVNTHVTRIDHVFNERDRLYGRLLFNKSRTEVLPIYAQVGADDGNRVGRGRYYNASGTWFHNLTPVTINELRFTFDNRLNTNENAGLGTGIAGKLGLPGTDETGFPRIVLNGYAALNQGANRLQTPIVGTQVVNHLTRVQGKHQFKAGFEFRYAQNDDVNRPSAPGLFDFNQVATGNSVAALLLGWAQRGRRVETLLLRTRADSYGAFFQDDWKITPKLTLNLGLRYDLDQPRWEKMDNRQNSFDRATVNPVSGTPGVVRFSGRDGLSRYAHNWDRNNFGPRIGFAWRPGERWVVRGGFALVYTGLYDQATPVVANLGFSLNLDLVSPDNGLTPALLLRNGLPPLPPVSSIQLTPGFGAAAPGRAATTSVEFFEPNNRRNGYLETFNLNIERQLARNVMIEVGYLATLGHKLVAPNVLTINQVAPALMGAGNAQARRPFPQFSDVSVHSAALGNSNYHAGNIKVDKRASGGLHLQANYTWAKMIDDLESRNEPGGSAGNGFMNVYDRRQDRGLSGWNIGHRLILSTVWDLPVGRGKMLDTGATGVLNQIFGGWSAGYIAEFRSGLSYGVIEQQNTTNAFAPSQRPNVVGDPRLSTARPKQEQIERWFNTAAFAAPAQFTFGNAGRTNGVGPGAIIMDLSVLKDFNFTERKRLQFRCEMLNFINHANFALPNLNRGNPNFGSITGLIEGNQSRIVQLGLHFKF